MLSTSHLITIVEPKSIFLPYYYTYQYYYAHCNLTEYHNFRLLKGDSRA